MATLPLLKTAEPTPTAKIRARNHVAILRPCTRFCNDPEMFMALAVNQEILGQTAEAVSTLEETLEIDQRPEIYLSLGIAELANGQRENARKYFLRAAIFEPDTIRQIPNPLVREEVLLELTEYLNSLPR